MNAAPAWTIGVGCWNGTHVRVHAAFALCVVLIFAPALAADAPAHYDLERAVTVALLYFAAIAAHVVGHVIDASRRGVEVTDVTLAPWGELHPLPAPVSLDAAINTQTAGIGANACAAAVAGILLFFWGDQSLGDLLSPFGSARLLEGDDRIATFRWAFWLNLMLAAVNLLPIGSLDGSRLLRYFHDFIAPATDEETARRRLDTIVRCLGILLAIAAYAAVWAQPPSLLPAWIVFTIPAIFAFFSAESNFAAHAPIVETPLEEAQPSERKRRAEVGSESSVRFDEEAFEDDGPFSQWMQERRDLRRQRKRELEDLEERRADEILQRVHEYGMSSLSAEDRGLLDRVSARLRDRQQRDA